MAVTEAAFALLGVIVGGLLAGGMQLYVAAQERRVAARAAARVVMADLYSCYVAVSAGADKDDWWIEDLPLDAWHKYRETLAATMELDSFHLVAGAFYRLEMNEILRKRGDQKPEDLDVDAQQLEQAMEKLGRTGATRSEWRRLPGED